uniref:(California timema) hypothetical protein n=1 Tax=Timema californicum TaxID=61474 RepID=A0A7R9J781_TIMCA|nr:unnamed protein product [Timema californicum]
MVELHITKMTIMRWTFIALACLVLPQVGARTTDDNNLKTQKYQWKTVKQEGCPGVRRDPARFRRVARDAQALGLREKYALYNNVLPSPPPSPDVVRRR